MVIFFIYIYFLTIKFANITIHMYIQEGPESICVFGEASRTNNFVESHTAFLNKLISRGSNLFTVIAKLLVDERRKSHDMRMVLDGAVGVYRAPDTKYKKRSDFIMLQQENLLNKNIDEGEFLMRLTCKYNPVAYNLANWKSNIEEDEEENVLEQLVQLGQQFPDGAFDRLFLLDQ